MSDTQPVTEPVGHVVPVHPQSTRIREALRAPGGMRQAVLLVEVLSRPVALRRPRSTRRDTVR